MFPPPHELTRTEAARRVAAHAAASNLFFAHFEHHLHLDGPDAWRPAGRPDLDGTSGWRAGVLREIKFRHFRLDRMIGSFHPGHGPKWTAHELCHKLVGWAWAPGASPAWVATAARLAELLPVALWYFYDAGAPRCPRHALSDDRFDHRCAACEAAEAGLGPAAPADPAEVERLRDEGDRFVDRELLAIARTRRSGEIVPHRWATLELATDGLAWASAHGPRLASPTFSAWVERFVPEGTGRFTTLDDLEARVRAVQASIRDGAPLDPWRADRRRWVAQDLGWRMAVIQADCEGDAAAEIDRLLNALAETLDPAPAIEGWRALTEDFELPPAEEVFAVGYDLAPGIGRSARQIGEGLATVCPCALSLLPDPTRTIDAFTAADPWVRQPLGERFATWLAGALPGDDPAELAALEAAVTHAPPMDGRVAAERGSGDPGGELRLAPGVRVLRASRDWRSWLGRRGRKRPELPPRADTALAVVREPDGQVALWETSGEHPDLSSDPARADLLAAGVCVASPDPIG
jgi:hypothetical protein